MARKRDLSPELWSNEQLAEVCRDARLLYIGCISLADDKGRLKASPRYLRKEILGYDDDVSVSDVQHWRDDLARVELVCRYEADGTEYLHMPTWSRWQSINRAYPSNLPACPIHDESVSAHVLIKEEAVSAHAHSDEDAVSDHDASHEQDVSTHAPLTECSVSTHDAGRDNSLDTGVVSGVVPYRTVPVPDRTEEFISSGSITRARAKRQPKTQQPEVVQPIANDQHASVVALVQPISESVGAPDVPAAARDWHDAMTGEPGYEPTTAFLHRVASYAEAGVDVGEEALKLRSWLASKQTGKKAERYSDLRALNWLKRARDDAPRPIRMTPPPTSARSAANGAKDWNKVARFITPSTNAVPTTETTA